MIASLARCADMLKKASCLLVLIAGLDASCLNACKYSVRDVAFVDLSRQTFDFITLAPSTRIDQLQTKIRPVANAIFLDSNVRLSWIASDKPSSHPAYELVGTKTDQTTFCLHREGSDPFPLRSLDDFSAVEESDVWNWLEPIIQTQTRKNLMEHLFEAYAVILVVEGQSADENQRVIQAAQSAASFIAKLIPEMPKPVDVPPQVTVVSSDQISQEASLLWSLDLDWKSPESPQAAVIIGRGRRLGPVLKADEVTATRLQEILAVAGQDCECDLDRSWMQGPMIPIRWGSDQEQTAYASLGFDPENPLVKAEISRILARGKNPISGKSNDSIGAELDMLLLGYSEEVIDFGGGEEPEISLEKTTIVENEISSDKEVHASLGSSNSGAKEQEKTVSDTQSGQTSSTASSAQVVGTTQAQPPVIRKVLVVLAGFCVLAFLGGIGVLLAGRKRE